jgi:hypothetical protein
VKVLATPRNRTNGERLDETKWVEYTGMDRAALIMKGYALMKGDWVKACKVAANEQLCVLQSLGRDSRGVVGLTFSVFCGFFF